MECSICGIQTNDIHSLRKHHRQTHERSRSKRMRWGTRECTTCNLQVSEQHWHNHLLSKMHLDIIQSNTNTAACTADMPGDEDDRAEHEGEKAKVDDEEKEELEREDDETQYWSTPNESEESECGSLEGDNIAAPIAMVSTVADEHSVTCSLWTVILMPMRCVSCISSSDMRASVLTSIQITAAVAVQCSRSSNGGIKPLKTGLFSLNTEPSV